MHFSLRCRFALLAGAIVNGSILEPKRSPRRANSTKQLGGLRDDGACFDHPAPTRSPFSSARNQAITSREGTRVRISFPPAVSQHSAGSKLVCSSRYVRKCCSVTGGGDLRSVLPSPGAATGAQSSYCGQGCETTISGESDFRRGSMPGSKAVKERIEQLLAQAPELLLQGVGEHRQRAWLTAAQYA